MKKASAEKTRSKSAEHSGSSVLRFGDLDTRIRGMNIPASAAREYLKHTGMPRVWPVQVTRLVDVSLSLRGQRIMARVRKFERAGEDDEAERALSEGMKQVSLAAAREPMSEGPLIGQEPVTAESEVVAEESLSGIHTPQLPIHLCSMSVAKASHATKDVFT